MDDKFFELFGPLFFEKYEPMIQEREKKAASAAATAATAAATADITERLIQKGMDGPWIADVTGYDRSHIDRIAQQLNRTVNWNEART